MKPKTRIALVPVALIFLVLAALHAVLFWGLTGLVRKRVLPEAAKTMAAEVTIEEARLNLFGGSLSLKGLAVSNPKAFEDPALFSVANVYADLALLSLLRQVADVATLNVEQAHLVISRNAKGKINVTEWHKAMGEASGTPQEPPKPDQMPEPAKQQPSKLPKAVIQDMGADLLVEYIDHKQQDGPQTFGLALRLTAQDVATFGTRAEHEGRLAFTGHLAEDPQSFVIDIRGTIDPLADPLRPSFDLRGSIVSVDLQKLKAFTEEINVEGDRASFDVALACRNGVFDSARSVLTLKVQNARITGKAQATVANLSVPIPVTGTLDNPKLDWHGALLGTLLGNLADNEDAILEALDIDKDDVKKEVDKAMDKLGGFLNSISR